MLKLLWSLRLTPASYVGFERYEARKSARQAFQVKGPDIGSDSNGVGSWSDARLRGVRYFAVL